MTITVRQQNLAGGFGTTSATLASAPVQGNLLCAVAAERSGATSLTPTSSGWTVGVVKIQSPSDGTFRKSHGTWYKFAGASESTTFTLDPGTGGANIIGIVEFQGSAGEMADLAANIGSLKVIATGYDTVANSHSSGTTAALASTNKLLIGFCYTKVGNGVETPYSDWSAGADALSELAEYNGGGSDVDGSWAWGISTIDGTNAVTATKDAGSVGAERGAIVSLLVFPITTTPTDPGYGHLLLPNGTDKLLLPNGVDLLLLSTNEAPPAGNDLVVADATHAHAAETVALTQEHSLAVAAATQAHTAAAPTLTQVHNLTVADATHAQSSEAPTLQVVLGAQDATHAVTSDSPTLTQTHALTVQAAVHGHSASTVALVVDLSVQDASHAHAAGSPALTQQHALAVDGAAQAQSADNVVLSSIAILTIQDATHGHAATTVALTQVHELGAQAATQQQASGSPALTQVHNLTVQGAVHAHTADEAGVNSSTNLTVADAAHTQAAATIGLTQAHHLTTADATHTQTTGSPALTQAHTLAVDGATHEQTADAVLLAQLHQLVAHDSAILHTADPVTLTIGAPLRDVIVLSIETRWRTVEFTTRQRAATFTTRQRNVTFEERT